MDRTKWNRKVFKVYKTMNLIEKKKHTKPYFCKRLFKLVFVLFKLQKDELSKDEIWRQHLAWLEVMGKQVDENLVRHQELVKKNGGRAA